jgi:hypothetical protein
MKYLVVVFCVGVSLLLGQQRLAPGDIAIIGYQSDASDSLSLMATVDIPIGTILHVTDRGWQANGTFRAGEDDFILNFTAGFAAGNVLNMQLDGSPDVNISYVGTGMDLTASGDQLFVYQIVGLDTIFLYGLHYRTANWDSDATSTAHSALPPGLVDGYTAISLAGAYDNNRYDEAVTTGTKYELLQAISNEDNWLAYRSETLGGAWSSLKNFSNMTVNIPSYSLSTISRSSGDVSPNGLLWMGYFSPTYQTNWIDSVHIQNRLNDGASINEDDIDSVYFYINGSTLNPTLSTPDYRFAWENDGAGGHAVLKGDSALFIGSNYFHIAYRLSGTRNPANEVGLQINALFLQDTAQALFAYPFLFSNDITLPVSLAPMSFSDKGKAGLELVVKTYSEASPSILRLMRSAGDEVVQIAEFETNGSVSHGKEYVFTDKTAAYGREYTYTLYENNVLTDKSLTLQRVPNSAEISQAFPNPFNPTTAVQVNLPERSAIDVAVYNIIGQVVYQTQLTNVPVGQLTLPWNGRNSQGEHVASGIYFFRVTIQGASGLTSLNKIQKIVLVK